MKTQFVNPKEKILEDLSEPIREAVLSAITPIISNAMTMYSDQQNKELREKVDWCDDEIDNQDAEIQRLMKELDEVKTSHYQKLDAQLVEDVERLTEENKQKDAEIQRLTKEVEELKLRLSGKTFFNPFEQLLSRMAMTLEIYNTGEDANIVILLSEYNALNHKP